MSKNPIEELSIDDLIKLFEKQVKIHGVARFIPLLEESPLMDLVEIPDQQCHGDEFESVGEEESENVFTDSDYGIDDDGDSSIGSESDGEGFISDDDVDDNQSVVDEVVNNLRNGNLFNVHQQVIFDSIHCPPFESIASTMVGICDCNHFGMGVCGQSDNFQIFPTLNFLEELEVAKDTIHSPLRIESNLLRKRLYKLLFHATDFGILEPNERRKLPNCAVAKIRQIYPSSTGDYMGFKEF